ncbi:MAG: ribokinase [Oscillospiraceae bacterium]|nr:ribokinase [Oscillospiraceae bacterium]
MKVLSFGSLNLDYVYALDHFVEAGETIAASERSIHHGGKGLNQSVALAMAGAQTYHAGRIGQDGVMLKDWLVQKGADVSLLETDPELPTGHAIIQVVPSGQNSIIILAGTNGSITETFVDKMLESFESGDLMLLQNETSCRDYAIEKAAEKGLKVALNPSPMTEELAASPALKYVSYFILNEIEGKAVTGETDPEAICRVMKEKYTNGIVVLTLGGDGAVYYDGTTKLSHGIYPVKAVDTTAAGDTFAGFFLATLAAGETPEVALQRASKAAAIAVTRPGASDSIPTLEEVLNTNLGEPLDAK